MSGASCSPISKRRLSLMGNWPPRSRSRRQVTSDGDSRVKAHPHAPAARAGAPWPGDSSASSLDLVLGAACNRHRDVEAAWLCSACARNLCENVRSRSRPAAENSPHVLSVVAPRCPSSCSVKSPRRFGRKCAARTWGDPGRSFAASTELKIPCRSFDSAPGGHHATCAVGHCRTCPSSSPSPR